MWEQPVPHFPSLSSTESRNLPSLSFLGTSYVCVPQGQERGQRRRRQDQPHQEPQRQQRRRARIEGAARARGTGMDMYGGVKVFFTAQINFWMLVERNLLGKGQPSTHYGEGESKLFRQSFNPSH